MMFQNRGLRTIFVHKRQREDENLIISSSIIYNYPSPDISYKGYQIKKAEIDGACGKHERHAKYGKDSET
jgi:hypothetical protein